MSKIAPYHTNSKEYPPENREVHHDYDNCPSGKTIKAEHKEQGKGGRPRCSKCKDLD